MLLTTLDFLLFVFSPLGCPRNSPPPFARPWRRVAKCLWTAGLISASSARRESLLDGRCLCRVTFNPRPLPLKQRSFPLTAAGSGIRPAPGSLRRRLSGASEDGHEVNEHRRRCLYGGCAICSPVHLCVCLLAVALQGPLVPFQPNISKWEAWWRISPAFEVRYK